MRMSEELRELWEPSEVKGKRREEEKRCSVGRGEVRGHELEEEFGFSWRLQGFLDPLAEFRETRGIAVGAFWPPLRF